MLNRAGSFAPGVPLADNSDWNRDIVQPSVNLTLAWRPTAHDTFRVSYARGVQAPSLIEFGGLQLSETPFPHFTIDLMGNPYLKPSILSNYEASYDHDFVVAKVGLRVFLQDWTDVKSSITGLGGLTINPTLTTNGAISYQNASNSTETGVELSASGKIVGGFNWHADTTYTDVKDSPFTGVNAVFDQVAFQETTPKFRGNLGVDWEQGPWETDANLHYVGDYQFYNLVTGDLGQVKAYTNLDMRVGYKFKDGITVAVSGQNLLTERQKQTTGLEAERMAQLTVSKAW